MLVREVVTVAVGVAVRLLVGGRTPCVDRRRGSGGVGVLVREVVTVAVGVAVRLLVGVKVAVRVTVAVGDGGVGVLVREVVTVAVGVAVRLLVGVKDAVRRDRRRGRWRRRGAGPGGGDGGGGRGGSAAGGREGRRACDRRRVRWRRRVAGTRRRDGGRGRTRLRDGHHGRRRRDPENRPSGSGHDDGRLRDLRVPTGGGSEGELHGKSPFASKRCGESARSRSRGSDPESPARAREAKRCERVARRSRNCWSVASRAAADRRHPAATRDAPGMRGDGRRR